MKIEIKGLIIEQILEFSYLGSTTSETISDIEKKITKYNNLNEIITNAHSNKITSYVTTKCTEECGS